MINLKLTSYLLIPILLVSSIAYYHLHSLNRTEKHPTLPQVISEVKKKLSEAKDRASVSVQVVQKRQQTRPLTEVVSVGTVLTSDEMSELQKRETEDLAAIQALQAVISASDAVIKPQQALITQDGIKIWIYKILLATGIIYIIYLLL